LISILFLHRIYLFRRIVIIVVVRTQGPNDHIVLI
jgi:hypothetical protein